MARYVKTVATILSTLALQCCYYLQPADKPLETLHYDISSSARDLLILLPGIGDYPQEFERHQFVDYLQACRFDLDAVAVNTHLRYYTQRTLLIRLKKDVVEPAFRAGYERVHFVGISLGGYGSLLYMREYFDQVSSLTLLAPYLGKPDQYAYLLANSGVDEPAAGRENIWPWLESLPRQSLDKIYMGYGRADQYAEGHRLLSRILPEGHSLTVPGDHSWVTWQKLWPSLANQSSFVRASGHQKVAEARCTPGRATPRQVEADPVSARVSGN